MKTYTIDYTKISETEICLYSAAHLLADNCIDAAMERIETARKLLEEFMCCDNLVVDNDIANGLIKQYDTFDDDQLDLIRFVFSDLMMISKHKKMRVSERIVFLNIINICNKQLGDNEYKSCSQFYSVKSSKFN